jgi:hypothetical protein
LHEKYANHKAKRDKEIADGLDGEKLGHRKDESGDWSPIQIKISSV